MVIAMVVAIVTTTPARADAGLSQTATVTTDANLRAQPNTTSRILDLLRAGTTVEVLCWAEGEPTFGTDRYGSMWLYTTRPGWVHSHLVTPVDVPECGPGVGIVSGGGYADCDEAKLAHPGPIYLGEPVYDPHLDRDSDGIACEWND